MLSNQASRYVWEQLWRSPLSKEPANNIIKYVNFLTPVIFVHVLLKMPEKKFRVIKASLPEMSLMKETINPP